MAYKIYVDMDGVLADFDKKKHEAILDWKSKSDDELWEIIWEKYPNWFLDLEPMEDMKKLWEYLNDKEPIVLTALPKGKNHYRCLWQKHEWLYTKVGWPAICCLRKHKRDYASEESILIDDMENNIKDFKKAGGVGILHKNAKSTIEELEKLIGKH